jgi:hypothetical protein
VAIFITKLEQGINTAKMDAGGFKDRSNVYPEPILYTGKQ